MRKRINDESLPYIDFDENNTSNYYTVNGEEKNINIYEEEKIEDENIDHIQITATKVNNEENLEKEYNNEDRNKKVNNEENPEAEDVKDTSEGEKEDNEIEEENENEAENNNDNTNEVVKEVIENKISDIIQQTQDNNKPSDFVDNSEMIIIVMKRRNIWRVYQMMMMK